MSPYLSDPPDVFDPGFLVEAEILVQPEANVVPVETVGKFTLVQKMLLESTCDGRLSIRTEQRLSRRGDEAALTFPLALRPVSQMVTPFCLSNSTRSAAPTEPRDCQSRLEC